MKVQPCYAGTHELDAARERLLPAELGPLSNVAVRPQVSGPVFRGAVFVLPNGQVISMTSACRGQRDQDPDPEK
jgi:hypothetical protein